MNGQLQTRYISWGGGGSCTSETHTLVRDSAVIPYQGWPGWLTILLPTCPRHPSSKYGINNLNRQSMGCAPKPQVYRVHGSVYDFSRAGETRTLFRDGAVICSQGWPWWLTLCFCLCSYVLPVPAKHRAEESAAICTQGETLLMKPFCRPPTLDACLPSRSQCNR